MTEISPGNLSMPLKIKLVFGVGSFMELKAGHFARQMKVESWQLKCDFGGECF